MSPLQTVSQPGPDMGPAEIRIRTASGPVRGIICSAGYVFYGVPYAQADRFRPARAFQWEGIRDCTRPGSPCAQPPWLGPRPEGAEFACTGSEDCLHLDVRTPSLDPEAGLPVCVFVHGGGFQVGSSTEPGHTGDHLADCMVYVSVSYRLGVLGGLYLADALGEDFAGSGSLSALDVLEALRWIRKNIGAFGGDPERVTVMGVSAGAKILGALMTLPEASVLFQQAWLESGATQALRSRATARRVAQGFLEKLPGRTARDLRTTPVQDLIRAQAELCDNRYSTCFFGPVLDDGYFSSGWRSAWEQGRTWRGRAVLTCCRREMAGAVQAPGFSEQAEEIFRGSFGQEGGDLLLREVRNRIRQGYPEENAWISVFSDGMYRSHTHRMAMRLARADVPVWLGSFDFPPAMHGMGMAFLMNHPRETAVPPDLYLAAERLAETMIQSLRSFICTGDPNASALPLWDSLSPEHPMQMVFSGEPALLSTEGDPLGTVPEYNYTI